MHLVGQQWSAGTSSTIPDMQHHQLTPAQNILLSRLAKTGHDPMALATIVSFLYMQRPDDELLDEYLSGSVPVLRRDREALDRHWEHAQLEVTGLQLQA